MRPNPWQILGLALAAAAVSVLLSPRARRAAAVEPWRVDQPDHPPERPLAEQQSEGNGGEAAPALH